MIKKYFLLLISVFLLSGCYFAGVKVGTDTSVESNKLGDVAVELIDSTIKTHVYNGVDIGDKLSDYVSFSNGRQAIIQAIDNVEYDVLSEKVMSNNQEAVLIVEVEMKNLSMVIQAIKMNSLLVGLEEAQLEIPILLESASPIKSITSVCLSKVDGVWEIKNRVENNDFFNAISGNLYQLILENSY